MSTMKEKNLRRFVAIYLASNVILSGVAYAEESEDEPFYANGQTITVTDENSFAYGLVGGSENSSVTASNITVESGMVSSITGGGSAEGGAAHVGAANITMTGGTVNYLQGGGDADYNGAASTVDTVHITIASGSIGLNSATGDTASINGVVGGGMAWTEEGENQTNTSDVNTVNLTISGGTIYKDETSTSGVWGGGIAGYTYGTGNATTSAADAHVDTVNLNISGGTIYPDVYAGGATFAEPNQGDDKITSTVDQATINISGGEIKGNVYAGGMNQATVGDATINIGGGKINGNISAEQNVTGSSALNFTRGVESTLDGKISGFNTVTVKSGAKTTLTGANAAAGDTVVQAETMNIEENSTVTIAKNMTFQLGSANSPLPAVFSLRSARVANGTLNLSGELKIAAGANLTLENTTLVSHATGMVTVGVKDNSVGTLDMAANSAFSGNRLNLNIDLPIDQIKNLTAAEINKIIEDALTPAVANRLTISNGTNAEYQYVKDASGKIVDIKLNTTYLGFYTGVRQANAYIAQSMIGNLHDRNTAFRSGEKADDFWINIRGGKTDIDHNYGKTEVKNQYYQLGYDWDVSSSDSKAIVGVYFSKIYGDITQNALKSDIDNAYDLGIYGMKEFNNGAYLGLVSRYGQTKNTAKIDDRKVDWKDKGYALSTEFGQRFAQKNGWTLEPYVQLTYNHLANADLNTGNTDISLEGSNLFDGKMGVRFIRQEQENPNNNLYAGISYARGLSGDFKMKSRDGMSMTEMDNDTNSFEFALGMNRQISKCSTINFQAKKEFGDYDGWNVQGMLNVNF